MKFPLERIAGEIGGKVVGGEGGILIKGISSLDAAGPDEISFYADPRYRESLERTNAAAVLVATEIPSFGRPQVVVTDPALAYAAVVRLFAPPVPRFPGVSEAAAVHESCRIGEKVSIYPHVYLGPEVEIGDEVTLFPGVYVGEGARIGNRCVLYPNVSILHGCILGDGVVVHPGTVIGSDGFGFKREGSASVRVPQIGIVQIDDGVEIGANNCIDRAALGKTWIKSGVKTDNLVHIAHNVVIGEDSIVIAQTGISGSCQIGKGVIIAGQVGIVDHVTVGDGVMIGPQSGVAKSIPSGEVMSGTPAIPHRMWLRSTGMIPRLPQINERMRQLDKRIESLERRLNKE